MFWVCLFLGFLLKPRKTTKNLFKQIQVCPNPSKCANMCLEKKWKQFGKNGNKQLKLKSVFYFQNKLKQNPKNIQKNAHPQTVPNPNQKKMNFDWLCSRASLINVVLPGFLQLLVLTLIIMAKSYNFAHQGKLLENTLANTQP